MNRELFPENTILCGYRGSIAHNLYIPSEDPNSTDDIDLMGVYLAPPEYYIGLGSDYFTNSKDETERYSKAIERSEGKFDVVSYELRKYMNLLLKGNPNVLSLLWIEEGLYTPFFCDYPEFGRLLIENRDCFLAKSTLHTSFRGYADGQLKRMTHFKYEGYMGEKRKSLVDKFGYDCKNAGHLIRLLLMGIECLLEGELHIRREYDKDLLLSIKIGEWPLEEVKEFADTCFKQLDIAYVDSPLPEEPDVERAEEIVMQILREYLKL